MEDFLKFLIVAGVILVGIYNEVKKNKSKKTKPQRTPAPMPPSDETDYEPTPLPEAWGRGRTLEDLFEPQPYEQPVRKPATPPANKPPKKQKRKKEEVSVSASLANSIAQDERNSRQGTHYDTPNGSSDPHSEYEIHSAEDARRAIIWGEILQRKY